MMFDSMNTLGPYALGGPGLGWSGYPAVMTTANGTVASDPGLNGIGGANWAGSAGPSGVGTVDDSTQSTSTMGGIMAWPAAHQTLFLGAVILLILAWYLHHKGMLE